MWITLKMIKKDTLFLVSEGEYSDYGIRALLRALTDIDVPTVWDEWLGSEKLLEHHLVKLGLAERVPYLEWTQGYDDHRMKWHDYDRMRYRTVDVIEHD